MYDPNTAILTAIVSQHQQNLAHESGSGDVPRSTVPKPDKAGILGRLLLRGTHSLTTLDLALRAHRQPTHANDHVSLRCVGRSELASNLD